MGQWRRSGVVVESSSSPKQITTFARPSRLYASDGVTKKQMNHLDAIGSDIAGVSGQNTAAIGDIFEFDVFARGNEDKISLGTANGPSAGSWDLVINGSKLRNWIAISTNGKAYRDNGGVWTDYTAVAGSAAAADVPAFAAPDTVNDAFYFGLTHPFGAIRINVDTPPDAGSYIWEYWNGAAYVILPNYWGEPGLFMAGTFDLEFDIPLDWVKKDPDGGGATTSTLYYIRQRRLITGGAVLPIYTQVWLDQGYDDYAAASVVNNRFISGYNFPPGYSLIQITGTGHNVSSTNYWITIGGLSIQ